MGSRALICGLDHIYLSVSDFARSERFYDRLFEALGLHKGDKEIAGEQHAHYVAPTFQLTIRPARTAATHDPSSPGLHHICLQAPAPEAVDRCFEILGHLGISASEPRHYPEYHEEYYATFFEDPDGMRLEIVARTSYREELNSTWEELDVFVNPLQARKVSGSGPDKV